MRSMGRVILILFATLGLAAARAAEPVPPPPTAPALIFAAASLSDSLEAVVHAFSESTHIPLKTSYASSAVLARQIEAGAPASVFFSADRESLEYLLARGLIEPGTEHDLLGNRLVLIAPADSAVQLQIAPGFAIRAALGSGALALGDPDSVPAGRYARAALVQLGAWEAVQGHLARAENVRAALTYVARGEAPLGIVYRTDALAEKRVRIVDTFPQATHPPIVYPVALIRHAGPGARVFLAWLQTEPALRMFERYGFEPHR